MQEFYIRDVAHARAIIAAYVRCKNCSDCPLNNPEGWRCSYLFELAQKYREQHKNQ